MTKDELKNICNSVSSKMSEDEFSMEKIEQRILSCSEDADHISNEHSAIFSLLEAKNYTEQLVYNILCEVLDIRD